VVTDKQGKPVTDLGKDDFEIYEDGKRQVITNHSFVSTQPRISQDPTAPRPADQQLPVPPVQLKPEQVRRTIAIVVDDLSLSMGSAESVQYYLRKYVEQQIEPGDLVAIIRASGGMGALQQFTADRRQLRAAVDRIRWNPQSGRIGVFKPIGDETLQSLQKGTIRDDQRKEQLEAEGTDFREQLFTVGMLGALNYVVRGLRDLPGRKSVLLFSEGFTLPGNDSARRDGVRRSMDRIEGSLNRLVEFANRSSVVLYAIDPRGIVVPMFEAADDVSGLGSQQTSDIISQRMHQLTDTANGLNYLARETGGFVVPVSNDLSRGIKRVLDDQNGYYLIGYVPAESTFNRLTERMPFHRITVKVKRPGLTVRTRGGFFGIANEEARPAPTTPMQQLTAAVTSPFTTGNIRLKLTSSFGNESRSGYYIRSWLHIDARDLSFADEHDGWKSATMDVAALTFGDNGTVVDQNIQSYTLRVKNDSLERTLQSGIVYVMDLPLKKPGAYQLRAAVRDSKTELVGSANQYIEVPNVTRGRLVLSTVALYGNDLLRDQKRIEPVETGESAPRETRVEAGPAMRRLRPGDDLNYSFVVFNARVGKAAAAPRLLMKLRLFRNGKPVYTGDDAELRLKPQTDWQRITVAGSLRLSQNALPGEYLIQLQITDTLTKEKHGTAVQWADFEIIN
jgi:VWFA-related protein